ncbi:MAG: hypothetical protein LBU32_27940 [Clostridiales bacterium]|jgi:hypothetical protein|nr:hypothetical protein [Clostridiales bacterium]
MNSGWFDGCFFPDVLLEAYTPVECLGVSERAQTFLFERSSDKRKCVVKAYAQNQGPSQEIMMLKIAGSPQCPALH